MTKKLWKVSVSVGLKSTATFNTLNVIAPNDRDASRAQACREMMARFVEHGGDPITAASIRANWHPGWGADPGKPDDIAVVAKAKP